MRREKEDFGFLYLITDMKLAYFILAGLHFLCYSGLPAFPLDQPIAEQALNVSITQVNARSRGLNLYGITKSSIKKLIPVGPDSYNMLLSFTIRETVCPKDSGLDPDSCDFMRGRFALVASCSSRVLFTANEVQSASVRCSQSSSSSSSESSSEEMMPMFPRRQGRRPYANQEPAVGFPMQSAPVESNIYRSNLLE
ncbi:secreted phosphoprotein 24 [Amia ocellicauda]|uniref:secreted phosphoprotein 24 n=1 Tax=Amia ocellicauda TaxID=2972642 RepID=UPI0034642D3E